MKICVITVVAHGLGGMQRHTHDLVRGLVACGHDVDVVCPGDESLAPDAHGARWRFVTPVDRDGDFTDARWRRESRAAFDAGNAECGYDVVHSEGSSALGLLGRRRSAPVPIVVEFHGNFLGLAKAAARRAAGGSLRGAAGEARHVAWLARQHFGRRNFHGFRGCHAIVVSGQQLDDTRRSHLLRRSRLHVVPNGVDTELWCPRERPPRSRPLLVATGRFAADKGFSFAIEAMLSLDADLVIVGEGPEEPRLRALARSLSVDHRVRFEAARPAAELAPLVASGDIYVFPTIRDEAAPLVLPEAMACGLPVVASRIGGIPEVVNRPGGNGVLVPPGDPAALAGAIAPLLADPALRRRIGAAARERVLERYTLSHMVAETVAVYEAAWGGRAQPVRTTATSSAHIVPGP